MSAQSILLKYISFFEARGHKRIANAPLVPENDPTTLFTSAGMQPLIPYLLGEAHPEGKKLVNVQDCFRAMDIDEVGDNRHTTFFRMLGNWSLGDYFKKEEIPWLWDFLTKELKIPRDRLYITVFKGDENIGFDSESEEIWKKTLEKEGLEPKIYKGDVTKNWWSKSGVPSKMPIGEIGGPDTEVYFKFDDIDHDEKCEGDDPTKCECGKFLEIANSVFIQFQKTETGFIELPQKNVDFGGGLERILAALENESDIFMTSLFKPAVNAIENVANKKYRDNKEEMRIISDHLRASIMLIFSGIKPSNKEQGYVLRRLLRRGFDNWILLGGSNISKIIEAIVEEEAKTEPLLLGKLEEIKNVIIDEENGYTKTLNEAKKFIGKRYKQQLLTELATETEKTEDEIRKNVEISADDAFLVYTSYGLSPTQIKSLGYTFDDKKFSKKMEEHQNISRSGAGKKFAGGLEDDKEQTIKGHTATHLMHQAIRDMLGEEVHQKGSNITAERVRFDFNFERNLTEEELKKLEEIVNEKINENLSVYFEFMTLQEAKKIGAIGLFDEKYSENVKIYLIGSRDPDLAYSKEFCGGPHVNFTGEVKSFKIIKQENIGAGLRRLYVKVG